MIREALPTEVMAVTAIDLACFGRQAWSVAAVQAMLDDDRRTVLHDDLEAYAVIAVAGDVADLERIAVMPSRRRRGVARGLLDALTVAAGAQGATRMLLEVAADNDAALAFYESYGFTTISTRVGYYPGGVDAVVMQLDLEEAR
ncbi:GNAT family N-acetyltransferase [Aeromicrobium sp. NPDC092404]|uniref:GNAT family N-acetyltransferase n=1 Tax=Aeromicrobium sp. NPDC092404 TaxID=3154976 RepID=UPI0034315ECB